MMLGADVSLSHVAAGCNRVVNALHWGEQGLLAYAAHNAVLIYHPEEARVLGTLLGHTDRVNCVRWLPSAPLGLPSGTGAGQPAMAALASGSADGSVRIWQWTPGTPGQPWRLAATLQAHSAPVTSLTILPLPSKAYAVRSDASAGGLLLVSTGGDGEAAVWECSPACTTEGSGSGVEGTGASSSSSAGGSGSSRGDAGDALPELLRPSAWRPCQRIALGHCLQGCAALAALPADPSWVLLALGGVDAAVRLYLRPPGAGARFAPVCQLSGHQDWVKGLAFAQLDDGKLLLASASQDKYVRVWAVKQKGQAAGATEGHQQPLANGAAAAAAAGDVGGGASLLTRYAPKPSIHTDRHEYSATLEALLIGHEDWVHGVAWQPRVPRPGGAPGELTQPACLLSASMDRTMMVWRPDSATGLWMCEESVGDAGANHLGYYTGVWAPDGSGIAAHGFTGALHIWRRAGADGGGAHSDDGWLPAHALGGHFAPVVDACWAADGACLLTVSTDQTARVTTRLADGHWCEVARPQVHGHDFSSVAAVPCPRGAAEAGGSGASGSGAAPAVCFLYAAGSEEKVVRVFEAPRAFKDTLDMARGRAVAPCAGGASALGALLPALGLSNKAVFEEDEGEGTAEGGAPGLGGADGTIPTGAAAYTDGPDMAPCAAPSAVAGPPLEEHLAQNTLWPEIHKLYGHGNELYCLAADPEGRFVASACRAQSADTAAVWLWDTSRWTGVAQLHAHTLTVTQLAFSPDGRFLASASRDRTVAIFERQEQQGQDPSQQQQGQQPPFRLVGRIKAHARIVWSLHWAPDSRLLATGSRDGKVKVWSLAAAAGAPRGQASAASLPSTPAATIDCGDSVRSVQFVPDCQPGAVYHLAAGLEDGSVQLISLAAAAADETEQQAGREQTVAKLQHALVWAAPLYERHAAAVRRLCWRREDEDAALPGEQEVRRRYQLASCSDDHSIRIFSVTL